MKKIYLPILALFLSSAVVAQSWSVPQTNSGLITKITASWCGACGAWGWEGFGELVGEHHEDHICMALYASSTSLFYTPDADVIAAEIGFGGYPNFAGNGEDVGTGYAQVNGIIESFEMNDVIANAAYEVVSVNENEIEILVKVKFFEAVAGTFLVAGYVIEDDIVGYQNSQGDSAHHHVVFRGAFTEADNDFMVTTSGADAGETFTKTLTIDRASEWKLSNLEVATVLWQQDENNQTDLIYVNGTKTPQEGTLTEGGGNGGSGGGTTGSDDPRNWPVGQDEIVTQTMELYPNPAKDLVNLKFNEAVDFKVEISDLLGKVVVNQSFTSKNRISMDVSSLPEGLYMIRVVTDNKTYLDRLIVK